ncbi:12379_t:CDS:2, partial [Dentiscutata heterogama]
LTNSLIIGVRLKNTQLGNNFFRNLTFHKPIPIKQIPKNLISAWKNEFQKPESGDVKITVQGQTIFASSSILARRSEYFQSMFNGSWSESIACRQYRYSIDIPDFDYQTTLQMLIYLYTDQVDINNCPNVWNLYTIANKYLISGLEMEAKLKILEGMNIDNAVEGLFSNAWKWPDLKKRFLRYVVDNFLQIRNSQVYKDIVADRSKYPMFLELNSEILLTFVPESVES